MGICHLPMSLFSINFWVKVNNVTRENHSQAVHHPHLNVKNNFPTSISAGKCIRSALRWIIPPLEIQCKRGKLQILCFRCNAKFCHVYSQLLFAPSSCLWNWPNVKWPLNMAYLISIVLKSTAATITAMNQQLDGQICCQMERRIKLLVISLRFLYHPTAHSGFTCSLNSHL